MALTFELLFSCCFLPVFKVGGDGVGVLDDCNVQWGREPSFKPSKGPSFHIHIASEGHELVKDGNIGIEVSSLHFESLNFMFGINMFPEISVGGFICCFEGVPMMFTVMPIAICDIVVQLGLLFICPIFDVFPPYVVEA